MRIVDFPQLSPEWFSARCGLPTASNFDQIITTKGEPSKQRQKYMYKLAGEKISGKSEETYQNAAMLRGIELESEARSLYEVITCETVITTGLCITEGEFEVGASPDGFVGDKGCIEIKCPIASTHVVYLLEGKLPTDYFQQTQGQLYVTGREWCDFISYYPSLRPLIVRVYPDKEFISKLDIELKVFCSELNDIINKIK